MIDNLPEATRLLKATQLMLLGKDNQPISDLYYALQIAVDSIEELQERREADKWRPISEPPKEKDMVIVWCEDLYLRPLNPCMGWRNKQYWHTFTANGEKQILYPVAWKPLPEPYESEDK